MTRSAPSVGLSVAVALLLGACGSDDGGAPPPPIGMTGGTGPPSGLSAGGATGGGGGDPACMPGGAGSGGSSGLPKFDVGGTGGVDLPVSCEELDAARSNLGCVFWAVDLPNDWNGTDKSPPAAEQPFAVVVANTSSLTAAGVAVYVGDGTTPIDAATVDVDDTVTFVLDGGDVSGQVPGADGTAFRIESDVPVTAYQFNPLDNTNPVYSNDASLLFPEHVLGKEHAVLAGDGIWLSMGAEDPMPDPVGAFVSVVAVEDGTHVTVEPSVPVLAGPVEDVSLARGRVLTVLADVTAGDGNLSGSRISSDRPVAVFAGNVATAEPVAANVCCADHIEHAIPPIDVWGTTYVVVPPPAAGGDGDDPYVLRITAAYDDTDLGYCPKRPEGAPDALDGFTVETVQLEEPVVLRSDDPEKPIFVAQFLESQGALPGNGQGYGDPAMIVVPPVAQFERKYVFAVPDGYGGGNYVTVVTADPAGVELDGAAVTTTFAEAGVAFERTYFYAHLPVAPGAHRIACDGGCGIRVVGYDEAVSYGYPGGAGLSIIAVPPVAG
ncbi:MAG: hypothetical protein D6705_11630 [Deltaproteobacteria bacterium]|nr:MAG: hypothetical protein D6705_11630 [Deltaproteobacteria bacterium]